MLAGRILSNQKTLALSGQQDMVSRHVFECPYAKAPLTRSCEVKSCSFNLPDDSSLSRFYRRCFLNYIEKGVQNPNHLASIEKAQFSKLSLEQKKSLIKAFFQATDQDVDEAQRKFYLSFFSIVVQDLLLDLPRGVLEPIPFAQCCVCGACDDEEDPKFFYLKTNKALPPGHGYCSWSCYQLKPPPILVIERILNVDFRLLVDHQDLTQALKKSSIPLITYWLFGGVPLT